MAGPIRISILANASQAKREFDSVSGKATGMGSKFGKAGKFAGAALVGGLALGGAALYKFTGFMKDSVDAARESNRVSAQTNAVLKSTGGVANITAKGVSNLATSISKKTGIDDEQIQSGENLLLTFTNVRNEVGRGNDIFNQATNTVTDMSAALGQDTKSSAIQLGKALNDPIKGVTALSRVGVSFTEQQKKQISTLVESGHTLAAQKIILGEVKKEFGGSAAAMATPGDKLKVTVGNIQESIGKMLIPILDKVATYLNKNLPKWFATAQRAFDKFKGVIGPVVSAIKGFFGGLSSGSGRMSGVTKFIRGSLLPAFSQIGQNLRGLWKVVGPIVRQIAASIIKGWRQIQPQVRAIFGSIKQIVTSALHIIASVIKIVTGVIRVVWRTFGSTILEFARNTFNNIATVIRGVFKIIAGIFKVVSSLLRGDWKGAWQGIKQIVSGALMVIKGLVKQGMNIIKTTISIAWKAISGVTKAIWNGLKSIVSNAIGGVVNLARSIRGRVLGALGNAGSWLWNVGRNIISGLIGGIKAMASAAVNAVENVIGGAISKAKSLLHIGSPSKVFIEIGKYTVQGLVLGLENVRGKGMVKRAASRLTSAIGSGFAAPGLTLDAGTALAGAGANAAVGTTVQISVTVPPTADKAAIGREIAGALDSYYRVGGRRLAV